MTGTGLMGRAAALLIGGTLLAGLGIGALAVPPVEPNRSVDLVDATSGPVEDDGLADRLLALAPDLNPDVLALALGAVDKARASGVTPTSDVLTVIDFSLPSATPRLWVFDTSGDAELLYHELVSHGTGSGGAEATRFSNSHGSKATSLGLFLTAQTYYGRNGYSLRIRGLEEGYNDNVYDRAVVVHGAWYVSEEFAARHGRVGRSWGCPAVRDEVARPLIDAIKDGSFMFAYYPDQEWLDGSPFLGD